MSKIPTCTGLIDPLEIGVVSVHEHIKPAPEDREKSLDFQIQDLIKARELGLKTIVELSPNRDIQALKEVSEKSGVQVIPSTGHYVFFEEEEKSYSAEKFYEMWLNEVEHGIDGSGIRPGVIKTSSKNLIPDENERKILWAAGKLQKDTGLPVFVHSCTGFQHQLAILEEAGADPAKICFSHVEAEFGWEGRTVDEQIDLLEEVLMKAGCSISYNNFGNWGHTKPENLAKIIKEMIARGYADRHFATLDLVVSMEGDKIRVLWDDINENGFDRTYSYLLREVLPWLERNGVSKEDAHKMVCENAIRLFS